MPGTALAPWIDEILHAARPTWLTVTTQEPDEVAAELQSAGLQLFVELKLLMTTDLRDRPAPPTQHSVVTATEGPLERVAVRAPAGAAEAARGMAAVIGEDVVVHDVHTSPSFRRQGLGSVVMSALAERALARGATTGLLMATADGAALYRKLGWVPQATMLTARAA